MGLLKLRIDVGVRVSGPVSGGFGGNGPTGARRSSTAPRLRTWVAVVTSQFAVNGTISLPLPLLAINIFPLPSPKRLREAEFASEIANGVFASMW